MGKAAFFVPRLGAMGQRPVPLTQTDDLVWGRGAHQDAKTHCRALEAEMAEVGVGAMLMLPVPTEQDRVKGEVCWAKPMTQRPQQKQDQMLNRSPQCCCGQQEPAPEEMTPRKMHCHRNFLTWDGS